MESSTSDEKPIYTKPNSKCWGLNPKKKDKLSKEFANSLPTITVINGKEKKYTENYP